MAIWNEEIADSLLISDRTNYNTVDFEFADSLLATDDEAIDWLHGLADALAVTDDEQISVVRSLEMADTARMGDGVQSGATVAFADSLTLADALDAQAFVSFADTAAASDATTGSTARTTLLADSLTARDEASEGADALVADTLTASDALSLASDLQIVESIAAADAVSDGGGTEWEASDTASAGDAVAVQVVTHAELADSLSASDAASCKRPAVAWLMNTESGAASWYSNFDFSDVAQVGDTVFAVGPDGLFTLAGSTDAGDPIDAAVQYGFTDFGGFDNQGNPKPSEPKKRVTDFWFGYTSDGDVSVAVETFGESPYTYTMPARTADSPRNNRVRPGKGLNARYWRVTLSNTDGCAVTVHSVSADVVQTSRRL